MLRVKNKCVEEGILPFSVSSGVVSQIGLIIFNIGLTGGLAKLGTVVGASMPAAFHPMESIQGSPLFGTRIGICVAVVFTWVLGFGATLAEPALSTLAVTVEKLTDRGLTQRQVRRIF